MLEFETLEVIALQRLTENAVEVSFRIPADLEERFSFIPGQFLTVKFHAGQKELRRSYSVCNSVFDKGILRIGVKRVAGGVISNHINDSLKVGSKVEVLPPQGRFGVKVNPKSYRTYYLIAAGSGITPILSILMSILEIEKNSYVNLIYGNRNEESTMFKNQINVLKEQYSERFNVVWVYSRPKEHQGKFTSYKNGRIDQTLIKEFVQENPPIAQNTEYLICGPEKMLENCISGLESIDVPRNRIKFESFGSNKVASKVKATLNSKLKVHLQGRIYELTISNDKTLLRVMIDNDVKAPYSCEAGVCSTCKCKLKSGKVHMLKNFALDEKELEEGYILSCQGIPLSEEVVIEFEQ